MSICHIVVEHLFIQWDIEIYVVNRGFESAWVTWLDLLYFCYLPWNNTIWIAPGPQGMMRHMEQLSA